MATIGKVLDRLAEVRPLDRVADPVSATVRRVLHGRAADLLHGTWLGHPVHPIAVMVPIGSYLSAAVLDLMPGQAVAARRLIGVGLLATPAAAVAGLADWSQLEPEQRRVGLLHAATNNVGTLFYAASWLARRRGRRAAGVGLGLAGLGCVAAGGTLGGHLAYALGAGFNHAADTSRRAGDRWHDLGPVDDLPDGGLARRDAGDTPLLVFRRADDVSVLVAECGHLGGPLQDGDADRVDGRECVRCPWHGSTFALDDGEVLRGPATANQPRFEVRVVDGRVQARAGVDGRRW
jgi:nitrite reductase/ring-hydroxylating ferredoxin subunit/uncharacterized membrane protein